MRLIHRCLGGHPDTDTVTKQADKTAEKSEEAMKESQSTLRALRQIRSVEQIAKGRRQ
jgi:hypothetical protein